MGARAHGPWRRPGNAAEPARPAGRKGRSTTSRRPRRLSRSSTSSPCRAPPARCWTLSTPSAAMRSTARSPDLRRPPSRRSARHRPPSMTISAVPVMRFETVADHARRSEPPGARRGASTGSTTPTIPLPERCRILTERLWQRQRARGSGRRDRVRIDPLPADAPLRFAERPETRDGRVGGGRSRRCAARDDHRLRSGVRRHLGHELPRGGRRGLAGSRWRTTCRAGPNGCDGRSEAASPGLPIVNAGPWGRDYHTRLERIHAAYGFDVLPDLVEAIVQGLLDPPAG